MNIKEIKKYREALLEKKRAQMDTIEKMNKNETAKESRYSPTELSNYDNHPADIGSELYQLEHGRALMEHELSRLGEIEEAIKRIDNGTFGLCEICGKEIVKERLDVIPQTRFCMECKGKKLAGHEAVMKTRSNEERVLDSPFGRKNLNRREDDEHEGLDFLNDLMKYGSGDSPQDLGGYRDYKNFYNNEEDNQGEVEKTDVISNAEYKKQIPD